MHTQVENYIKAQKEHPLNINLDSIKHTINAATKENRYNIYITDEELIIKNSTFKKLYTGATCSFYNTKVKKKRDKVHRTR